MLDSHHAQSAKKQRIQRLYHVDDRLLVVAETLKSCVVHEIRWKVAYLVATNRYIPLTGKLQYG